MKKIFLSTIIMSSLSMSGTIEECSHNVDMQEKYRALYDKEHLKYNNALIEKNKGKERYYSKKKALYNALINQWVTKAKTDCKDVLSSDNWEYATNGFFPTAEWKKLHGKSQKIRGLSDKIMERVYRQEDLEK